MLKKSIIAMLIWSLLAIDPSPAFAHLGSFSEIISIDGKTIKNYPVEPSSYLPTYQQARDLAPEKGLLNQQFTFRVDKKILSEVFPQNQINKVHFQWEFGDGAVGRGLAVTHRYNKIGSYVVGVTIDPTDVQPDLSPEKIEEILIHILPDRSYQLPTATIKINGEQISSAASDTTSIDLGKKLEFDGSASVAPSAKIANYQWNFDDGEFGDGKTISHTYAGAQEYIAPILRVTDQNGFIADARVNLKREKQPISTESIDQNLSIKRLMDKILSQICRYPFLFICSTSHP